MELRSPDTEPGERRGIVQEPAALWIARRAECTEPAALWIWGRGECTQRTALLIWTAGQSARTGLHYGWGRLYVLLRHGRFRGASRTGPGQEPRISIVQKTALCSGSVMLNSPIGEAIRSQGHT